MPNPPRAPVIDVWYGDNQTFGQNGIPQAWVNVLGNVATPSGIASLTYSLNDGPEQPLRIGPDDFRLVDPGDFNAEIAYSRLRPGPNVIRFAAIAKDGAEARHTVTINYVAAETSPLNYSIDWSTVSNIQSVAQIVDGNWALQNNAARTMQTGYDRLIDIGDMRTWTSLVGTAEITFNAVDGPNFGAGAIVGWTGHTLRGNGEQPRTGHPYTADFGYSETGLGIGANTSLTPETVLVQDTTRPVLGVKYILKFRVTSNTWGGSHFSQKIWRSGTAEPPDWQLEADGGFTRGSILIGAHHADISVGKINVTALDSAESSKVRDSEVRHLLSGLSLVVVWVGGVFLCSRARSPYVGALLLFLLMVPFFGPVRIWIIHLLQRESTEIAYLVLRVLRLPVIREGLFLSVRDVTTSSIGEIGSIRSSMALLIICILAARLYLRTWWEALPFVLLGLSVSVFQNGMRIAIMELLSLYVDSNFLQKNFHKVGGMVFFLVGLLMLWPIFVWLKSSELPDSVAGSQGEPAGAPEFASDAGR